MIRHLLIAFCLLGATAVFAEPGQTMIGTMALLPPTASVVVISASEIDIAWVVPANVSIKSITVERSIAGKQWTKLVQVGLGIRSYRNTGLKPNTPYRYRVLISN